MTGLAPPPTRVISWQQSVTEADPYWQQDRQRPWIYEFSNGRRFTRDPAIYEPSGLEGLLDETFFLDTTLLG